VVSYVQYLKKFFYPTQLAVFYPHAGTALSMGSVAFSAVLLAMITGVAIWQWRVRPWIAVGWFWYLGTLVPAIGLVQVGMQAMADRYTYVPLLGIAIALVWSAQDFAVRCRIPAMVRVIAASAVEG